MNDYFSYAKTNGSSKSNTKLLTVVTEVTISFKWNDPHDIVVVKIPPWITTEARIMTEVAKLRFAGRMSPADQFNPVRQTPVFCWFRAVSSPLVTRQSRIWPSGRNVW